MTAAAESRGATASSATLWTFAPHLGMMMSVVSVLVLASAPAEEPPELVHLQLRPLREIASWRSRGTLGSAKEGCEKA